MRRKLLILLKRAKEIFCCYLIVRDEEYNSELQVAQQRRSVNEDHYKRHLDALSKKVK